MTSNGLAFPPRPPTAHDVEGYGSIWATGRTIVRAEGIAGLYFGLSATIVAQFGKVRPRVGAGGQAGRRAGGQAGSGAVCARAHTKYGRAPRMPATARARCALRARGVIAPGYGRKAKEGPQLEDGPSC